MQHSGLEYVDVGLCYITGKWGGRARVIHSAATTVLVKATIIKPDYIPYSEENVSFGHL